MAWKDLSLKEKAAYIHTGVRNGLTNLDDISKAYNKFADGGPKEEIKNFDSWMQGIADAWGISKEEAQKEGYYDYEKYYKENTEDAYKQLDNLRKGINSHFPDKGNNGTYKTKDHPTYPEMGYSWNNDETIYYPSERQVTMPNPENIKETNTDRILDYLGRDLQYKNGAAKAVYQGGTILPTIYVTPNESYTVLERNPLNTGWQYKQDAKAEGGPLPKPFSYNPIPSVRYKQGGYLTL